MNWQEPAGKVSDQKSRPWNLFIVWSGNCHSDGSVAQWALLQGSLQEITIFNFRTLSKLKNANQLNLFWCSQHSPDQDSSTDSSTKFDEIHIDWFGDSEDQVRVVLRRKRRRNLGKTTLQTKSLVFGSFSHCLYTSLIGPNRLAKLYLYPGWCSFLQDLTPYQLI